VCDLPDVLGAAIEQGVRQYNSGNVQGCATLYRKAADAAMSLPAATDAERTILRAGLQEAGSGSDQHASWALRRAFDDVLKLSNQVDLMFERAQMLAKERERATQPMQEEIGRLHAEDLRRQEEQYRRWAAIPEAPLLVNSQQFPFPMTRSLAPQPWSGPLRPEQRPWPANGEPSRPHPQQQPSAPEPQRPIQPSWLASQPRPPGVTRYPVKKDVCCCCFATPMTSIPPNRLPRLRAGMNVCLTANYQSIGNARNGPLQPGDVGRLVQDYLTTAPGYQGRDCYQVDFKGFKHWYEEGTLQVAPAVLPAQAPVTRPRLKVGTRVRLTPNCLSVAAGPSTLLVRVFRIINFKDTAGFMDKTDPYVKLQYGTTMHKTAAKNNAGGNAVFNEVFSFVRNTSQHQLQVAVYDSDTLRDDLLGATTIDLSRQRFGNSEEELRRMQDGQSYDMFDATGKVQGQVVLAFAVSVSAGAEDVRKGPLRPGDVGTLVQDYLLVDPTYQGKDTYQVSFNGSKHWYVEGTLEQSRLKVGTRVRLSSSPQKAPASPGTLRVRVFRIINFKDTAGFMDKTDPYVKLQYGTTMHKTAAKNNAGGNAVFNEVFSFVRNTSQHQLQVAVYDSDTLRDDLLGATTIDLSRQRFGNSEEELRRMQDGQSYDMFDATGKVQGQVVLAFAVSVSGEVRKGPLRPGDVGTLVEDYLLVDPKTTDTDNYEVLFNGSKHWYEDWEIEEVTTPTSPWEEIGPIEWEEGAIAVNWDLPIYQTFNKVPVLADEALLSPGLCLDVCLGYVLLSFFRLCLVFFLFCLCVVYLVFVCAWYAYCVFFC
jgi:hypothetical protein